jgi:hypothetical protein
LAFVTLGLGCGRQQGDGSTVDIDQVAPDEKTALQLLASTLVDNSQASHFKVEWWDSNLSSAPELHWVTYDRDNGTVTEYHAGACIPRGYNDVTDEAIRDARTLHDLSAEGRRAKEWEASQKLWGKS